MSGPHIIRFKLKQSSAGGGTSSGQWETVQWDGPHHLTTLELKRHITHKLGLQDSQEGFEFIVSNASTGEEYRDDNFIIHRNTSVSVRKIIGSKERAALLKMKPTTGLSQEHDKASANGSHSGSSGGVPDDEEQLLNLVHQSSRSSRSAIPSQYSAQSANPSPYAQQTYQRQSHGAVTNTGNLPPITANSKPHAGYICHRCQQPGHFIRFCPTNGDPAYDGKRPKAAKAVEAYENNAQKFFLRDVEDPKALTNATTTTATHATSTQPLPPPSGGALPSSYSPLSHSYPSSTSEPPRPRPEWLCPLCARLFEDATVVPCCYRTFCRACIENALRLDPHCPLCRAGPIPLQDLKPNTILQQQVDQYKEQLEYSNRHSSNSGTSSYGSPHALDHAASPVAAADTYHHSGKHSYDRPSHHRSYPSSSSRQTHSIPTYESNSSDQRGRSPPRYKEGGHGSRERDRDRERERDRDSYYQHRRGEPQYSPDSSSAAYRHAYPPSNHYEPPPGAAPIQVYDENYDKYIARDSRYDRGAHRGR